MFSRKTPEGFVLIPHTFKIPENADELDPWRKRRVTICNLFANHQLSVTAIARLLDVEMGEVISALVDHGMIKERRHKFKWVMEDKRVHKYHISQSSHYSETEHTGLCGHKDKDWIIGWFVASQVVKRSEICQRCWQKYRRLQGK